MESISIETFAQARLIVGKILSVQDHPNADKLYIVTVDIGEEQRQLVAGIKSYYAQEDLLGKNVIIIKNLQPAVIRGVESQGMLLAATDEQTKQIAILTVETDVAAGSVVQ